MSLKNLSVIAANNTLTPPAGAPETSTKFKDWNDIVRLLMADTRSLAASNTIASAATTDLGSLDETFLTISGIATITSFGTVSAGIYKFVTFSGALTLTHNATSLILLGGANRTTVAGDCGLYLSLGGGNWKEYFYSPIGAYQPLDAQLTTLAGITAQQATDLASLSTFMGTVLNDPDDATARATLGVVGKNKIINGGFAINQRVYVSGTATTVGQYTLDRWKVTSAGGITFSTTANKTTVTIPAGQTIQQVIEGLNLQSGTYTLSWEGTAQGKIGAGSLSASGVTGSITGGTDTTIEFGPGTVANVQLEFGSVATPFEHRPYGTELALCQRYYEKSYAIGTAPATATTTDMVQEWVVSGAGAYQSSGVRFTQEKRALPTITIYSSATGATGVAAAVVAAADKTTTLEGTGTKGTCPYFGLAAADLMRYHWTASAEF